MTDDVTCAICGAERSPSDMGTASLQDRFLYLCHPFDAKTETCYMRFSRTSGPMGWSASESLRLDNLVGNEWDGWAEAGARHDTGGGHWHEPNYPSCVVCRMRELEAQIKELEHEIESWKVTEAVRSHPDYASQLGSFKELMKEKPCAVCGLISHSGAMHASELFGEQ